jgi:hypothetical protein
MITEAGNAEPAGGTTRRSNWIWSLRRANPVTEKEAQHALVKFSSSATEMKLEDGVSCPTLIWQS